MRVVAPSAEYSNVLLSLQNDTYSTREPGEVEYSTADEDGISGSDTIVTRLPDSLPFRSLFQSLLTPGVWINEIVSKFVFLI
jgi:hypothetical protein